MIPNERVRTIKIRKNDSSLHLGSASIIRMEFLTHHFNIVFLRVSASARESFNSSVVHIVNNIFTESTAEMLAFHVQEIIADNRVIALNEIEFVTSGYYDGCMHHFVRA